MGRVREEILPEINEELVEIMPEWGDLHDIDEGLVCVHTLGVVYCVMNDSEFSKMSPREKNILKWAALLHDIKKQGPPVF
jgi:hypothetical protein